MSHKKGRHQTNGLMSKFAVKLLLKIPPHLKYVTTLPCEILMSEN